ncbi:nucleotidyltransferase family protein [Pedobacter sp. MC2016-14]|uniref:nucleotidyltransferase family protein n=1 Tax=Pedobacter sp. MC2016-14 TaxID=2897327 RepID=UPI001E2D5C31|nr:nucleotidyltransferase family protein [Pedobacter sp. MC2016-14]MCD0486846.1 nucleotidyltransferase family protein [Pedobacter sp. MC2016-14]
MRSEDFNNLDKLEPAQQALVKACLSNEPKALEGALRQWEKLVVMDDLSFSAMRLIPLFYHKIQEAGLSSSYEKRLKVIYKHWWLKTQHILNQVKTVNQALQQQGIKPILIKGISLLAYYDKAELRPMADFDLLIKPNEISSTIQTLKILGYQPKLKTESILSKYPKLVTDFTHSIECVHTLTGTELDLHWRIGSSSSYPFTAALRNNLESFPGWPAAQKPKVAFEVYMIIIHAVMYGAEDNLNWMIDIQQINSKTDQSFWPAARQLALAEKKEELFDYGCHLLQLNGIYSGPQLREGKRIQKITIFKDQSIQQFSSFKLTTLKIKNVYLILKYLYPHKSTLYKIYQGFRRMQFHLLLQRHSDRA